MLKNILNFLRMMVLCICIVCSSKDCFKAATVLTDNLPCTLAEDQLFIYYDANSHQETIIFNPSIRFRRDFFLWILPVPSEAKVTNAGAQIFERLNEYVKPKVQIQLRSHWKFGSFFLDLFEKFTNGKKPGDGEPITIPLGKAIVGRRTSSLQQLEIVKEKEGKLLDILSKSIPNPNYKIPDKTLSWLKSYQDRKFSWVVIQVKTDIQDTNAPIDEQVTLPPFSVTFETSEPYIPMNHLFTDSPDNWRTAQIFKYYIASSERSEILNNEKSFFSSQNLLFADRISQDDWSMKILNTANPEIQITSDLFLTAFTRSEKSMIQLLNDGTIIKANTQNLFHFPVQTEIQDQIKSFPVEGALLILIGIVLIVWKYMEIIKKEKKIF